MQGSEHVSDVELQESGVDAQKPARLRRRRYGRVVVVLERLQVVDSEPGGFGDLLQGETAKLAGLPKPGPNGITH